jgi:hypothetical protein
MKLSARGKFWIMYVVILTLLCVGIAKCHAADLKELYAQYGQLQIQAEIIQSQTMQVKKAIAEELNKPIPKEVSVEVKE